MLCRTGQRAGGMWNRGPALSLQVSDVNASMLATFCFCLLQKRHEARIRHVSNQYMSAAHSSIFFLPGHEDSITAAAIASCGRRAITVSDDGTARCWVRRVRIILSAFSVCMLRSLA